VPFFDRIILPVMAQVAKRYALVAYVRNSMGRFVESMRRDLHPEHTHLAAHITVLPPRPLSGSEEDAIAFLRREAPKIEAFEVTLGDVETFHPATPTVFIRVQRSAHRIRDVHDRLNVGPLECHEEWPYMPHLTIVKMPHAEQTPDALGESRRRWADYQGSRTTVIDELAFVRESENNQWIDLARFSLTPAPVKT
jgi:2'-5' RNA ligase